MSDIIRKAGEPNVVKKAGDGKSYSFVISSQNEDLTGDVIIQKGIRKVSDRIPGQIDHSGSVADLVGWWSQFRLSPDGKKTIADLNLFEKGISQTADLVRGLLDAGVQMASSVGFKSINADFRDKSKGYSGGMLYKEINLLEVSVVVVPCNMDALSVVAKGLGIQPSLAKSLVGLSDDEISELVKRKNYALTRSARLLAN